MSRLPNLLRYHRTGNARLFSWLIIILAGILVLTRLGDSTFWDDEAQTGIIARNFLQTGQLTGWDGRNLFAYRNGALLSDRLRVLQPPLDILVTATSFRAFGVSAWAGRLPFALAGILTLVVFWRLAAGRFGANSARAHYALLFLALSVPFLLNVRQCRYYALALLFSVSVYAAYARCLAHHRVRDFVLLTLSALLLFLSNFLIAGAFLAAIALLFLTIDRGKANLGAWVGFAISAAVYAAVAVPYALALNVLGRQDIAYLLPWGVRKLILVFWNLRELNLLGVLPWPVIAALALPPVRRAAGEKFCRESNRWLFLLAANSLVLALLSPQAPEQTRIADLRFLMAALPLGALFCAVCAARLHDWRPRLGATFAALLLATNWLCLAPGNARPRLLLPAYVGELAAPVPTAAGEVVRFLVVNAKQDDVVMATPAYFNYPLLFHLGDRIRIGGQLDAGTPLPPTALIRLSGPFRYEETFPDWVVAFGLNDDALRLLDHLSRPHRDAETGREQRHLYTQVQTLAVSASQPQRPELPWHRFAPDPVSDPEKQGVTIFRRMR